MTCDEATGVLLWAQSSGKLSGDFGAQVHGLSLFRLGVEVGRD